MKRYQILALSGGGIRGLYTISFLARIEELLAEKTNQPDYNIANHFDMISGTSIGGIFALGLAKGFTARELLAFIDDHRTKIFPNGRFLNFPVLGKLIKFTKQSFFSLYNSDGLREFLKEKFEEAKISDLKTRVIIPAINGTTGKPKMYKTPHNEVLTFDAKLKLVDVALATSAAPTYFAPHLVENKHLMVDGGLIANGPALIAYHEATNYLKWPKDNIYILSVGTMGAQSTLNSERRLSWWGYLTGWSIGRKILELTLSCNEGMQNFMVEQLLQERFISYDEVNTPDQSNSITLDNASDKAAQMLRGRGDDSAQNASGHSDFMALFNHTPDPIIFYKHGEAYEIQRT